MGLVKGKTLFKFLLTTGTGFIKSTGVKRENTIEKDTEQTGRTRQKDTKPA